MLTLQTQPDDFAQIRVNHKKSARVVLDPWIQTPGPAVPPPCENDEAISIPGEAAGPGDDSADPVDLDRADLGAFFEGDTFEIRGASLGTSGVLLDLRHLSAQDPFSRPTP